MWQVKVRKTVKRWKKYGRPWNTRGEARKAAKFAEYLYHFVRIEKV